MSAKRYLISVSYLLQTPTCYIQHIYCLTLSLTALFFFFQFKIVLLKSN